MRPVTAQDDEIQCCVTATLCSSNAPRYARAGSALPRCTQYWSDSGPVLAPIAYYKGVLWHKFQGQYYKVVVRLWPIANIRINVSVCLCVAWSVNYPYRGFNNVEKRKILSIYDIPTVMLSNRNSSNGFLSVSLCHRVTYQLTNIHTTFCQLRDKTSTVNIPMFEVRNDKMHQISCLKVIWQTYFLL